MGMSWDRGEACDLYFMQVKGGGPIKVGVSADVRARMNSLRSYHPSGLELLAVIPGSVFREQLLMLHLKPFGLEGEWFQSRPETWRVVLEAADTGDLPWLAREAPQLSYGALLLDAERIAGSRDAAAAQLGLSASSYRQYRFSQSAANPALLANYHFWLHGVGPAAKREAA